MPVETLNWFLGLGTIAMQAVAFVLVIAYLWREKSPVLNQIASLTERYALWAAFILGFAGVLLTLYYSEIVGYVPCGLCWVTRIFFYPQVILFGLALYKKDDGVADYSLALALPGAVIALYKHYLEMGGSEVLPCPASGAGDCSKRYIFEFGYITMPMMGFSLLVLFIILMLFVRARRRRIIELPAA